MKTFLYVDKEEFVKYILTWSVTGQLEVDQVDRPPSPLLVWWMDQFRPQIASSPSLCPSPARGQHDRVC